MQAIKVEQAADGRRGELPVFPQMDEVIAQVGRRAFEQARPAPRSRARLWPADQREAARAPLDPMMPFGGSKQSGWGREFGKEALDSCLKTKAVTLTW